MILNYCLPPLLDPDDRLPELLIDEDEREIPDERLDELGRLNELLLRLLELLGLVVGREVGRVLLLTRGLVFL